MTTSSKPSVTIIGAGPTGLAAALALVDRGCVVRVLERNDATTTESRAVGVNRRSLLHLETVGAAAPILAASDRLLRARFFDRGKRLAEIHIPVPASGPPMMVALPQSRTENILADLLAKRGCNVEWECEAVGVAQTDDAATVTVRTGDGDREIASDFVLGAGGSRSVTRKSLGLSFEGHSYEGDWSLFDAVLDWPDPDLQAMGYLGGAWGDEVLIMITLGDGRHRVIGQGLNLEARVAKLMKVGEVSWRNEFTLSERRVERYGRGRIWVAGDAAHVHSPVGGQGMNLGIDDAFDFAETLTGSRDFAAFEARRLKAARNVMARADRGLRLMTATNPVMRVVRNGLIRMVTASPRITQMLANAFFR